MFGNAKNNQNGKTNGVISTPSTTSSNSLVQGTQIEGSLYAEKDIRIDGIMTGNLNCKGKVIIGPTGQITGDIQCENAVIEGRFEGSLYVSDVLHVKETAQIEGDVTTQKLIVQPGSVFNVKCKMGTDGHPPAAPHTSFDDEAMDLQVANKSKAVLS